jgi:hypothetical protein
MDHLKLNNNVAAKYKEFWTEDTQGINEIDEEYFVVQQSLLERFLTAVQIEADGF